MDVSKSRIDGRTSQVNNRTQTMGYMVIKTVFMVLAPAVMGVYLELAGPTLPDLMSRVNSNYEEIARALVARSVGYFLSSMSGGLMIDMFPGHVTLFLSLAFVFGGMGTLFAPWVKYLGLLAAMFLLQGLGQGSIDTYNNYLCMAMWKDKAASPVHALHFGFGLGAFIAPQLARPFISNPGANRSLSNVSESWMNSTGDTDRGGRIEVAYGISALLCAVFCAIFMFFYMFERNSSCSDVTSEASDSVDIEKRIRAVWNPATCAGGDKVFGVLFFCLVVLLHITIVGGERAYGKFLFSYATQGGPQMSTDEALMLNTVFWVCFTGGRGMAIIVARWVHPKYMLAVEVLLNVVCVVALVVWGSSVSLVLWVFTGLLGASLSMVFPAALAWANRYVIMKGSAVALCFIGSACGGMLYQWISGYLFQYHGPEMLLFVMVGYGFSLLAVVILQQLLVYSRPERFELEQAPECHNEQTIPLNSSLK